MKSWIITMVTAVLLATGGVLQAEPPEREQQRTAATEQTLTGCLTEGSEEGSFVLKTESGEQVTVSGTEELGKHVGHTVRLTGKMSKKAGDKSFEATKIEHIAASCQH